MELLLFDEVDKVPEDRCENCARILGAADLDENGHYYICMDCGGYLCSRCAGNIVCRFCEEIDNRLTFLPESD